MKQKKLTGTKVPCFTYDTPYTAENNFYALCEGDKPLVLVFLSNFGHPISRAYITAYLESYAQLITGRLACVVRSDPQRIAQSLGGAQLPFPIICDADGVLYDYFGVRETTSFFDWTPAARRIVKAAKKEGYRPEKGVPQLLPLTMFLGAEGEVLYAHRARSLTDLPEDCEAIEEVCLHLLARAAVPAADAPALEREANAVVDASVALDAEPEMELALELELDAKIDETPTEPEVELPTVRADEMLIAPPAAQKLAEEELLRAAMLATPQREEK